MKQWLIPVAAISAAFLIGTAYADRDGSGNYTVPNTFTAGSTITAAGHNQNWSDIADEMTNSLPRDGQAAMTGQFKAATGSAAAPGISFSADTDTGFVPSGSGITVVVGGSSVGEFAAGGFDGSISGVPPAGTIMAYAGTSAPSGYLLCYGQAVSRTTYSDLFDVISTTYGSGDGATTFNLPDLRGRAIAGQDDMGGSSANRLTGLTNGVNGDTLAAAGGLESFTLATANMPSHTHTITDTRTYEFDQRGTDEDITVSSGAGSGVADNINDTVTITMSSPDSGTITNSNTGSTTAMGHIQPTLILNYIIKI